MPQTGISDWLNYINQSSGAQNAMTNLYSQQLGAQRQQFGENLIGGAAIGSGLGALGGSPMGQGISSGLQNWAGSLYPYDIVGA